MNNDRTQFIGGSDVAAILGVSPWKSAFRLYQEKIGAFDDPVTPEQQRRFDRGHRWEPVVVDMLIDELRDLGHDVGVIARNQRYTDAEHPFLAAEIDLELMIDGEEVNGEIKTVHPFAARDWGGEWSDEIPIYYAAQVMHGLMIKPRRRAIVAALIGVDDLRVHYVDRDDETIAGIRAREVEFWRRVKEEDAPDPTDTVDVKWLYQRDGGTVMEADGELLMACQELKDMKADAKNLEAGIEVLSTKIMARMGNAAVLIFNGQPVATWRNNRDSVVTDWKALVHYHWPVPPRDLVEQFTTTKPGARPFILK